MLREPGYQENALRLGKGGYDIHAYHEHGDFHPHFVRMVEERFLPMRKRAGVTEPWWANETALTSSGGNEKPQAMALYKKLIYAWSRGAIGYNWYDLRNDGDDPNHGEHNYGMMTRDFYPKPVYTVYNTLTTLFGGKEFVRQLDAGEGEWLFLFRGGEEMALAAWSENGGTLPVIVRTDAASAEAVDLMNHPAPGRNPRRPDSAGDRLTPRHAPAQGCNAGGVRRKSGSGWKAPTWRFRGNRTGSLPD